MTAPATAGSISPGLLKVRERAKLECESGLRSLTHHIDESALIRAHGRLRKNAAVGVDGVGVAEYGQDVEGRARDLHQRLKDGRWRHQPVRRVHIPKDRGKTRPIGVSTTEDKIVQGAIAEVMEAIYEPVFSNSSYGFRRGRSPHDALRALNGVLGRGGGWIVEADIQSYFDSIDRKMLMEMLRERIADESLIRLIGKCLHVGILDGEEYSEPSEGTVQGSVLSPLLGNVYLHHVLDRWFEREVGPRLRGAATLVRYADDFIIALQYEDDAKRLLAVLHKRFARYGLTLQPSKTRMVSHGRPTSTGGKRPSTFDFLGFTHYWRRSRYGKWVPGLKTSKTRLRRALGAVAEWCRRQRHRPVKEQHATLKRKLDGHLNYFGINGNQRGLKCVVRGTERIWWKWLRRRSQRNKLTWTRFARLLKRYPLPRTTVRVQFWRPSP